MTLFTSADDLAATHTGTTKWDRLIAAIANAGAIEDGVAHSIGDSLTYWRATGADVTAEAFTGHRRYLTVLVMLAGAATVELAPTEQLTRTAAYSDLSDRELFAQGATASSASTSSIVSKGQILAIPIDLAWRLTADPDVRVLVVRLTVEGATFHNK
ncbi:MAG: hypothetical protein ACOH17_15695 [Cellulomonas sp.]